LRDSGRWGSYGNGFSIGWFKGRKTMKQRPRIFAIILILSLALLGLSGCKELKEIKASLVESLGVKSLGAYENKVLMLFILDPEKDFFINVFNFNKILLIRFGLVKKRVWGFIIHLGVVKPNM
jgi:hypothetical protein